MSKLSRHLIAGLSALSVTLAALPGAAQWVGSGRWDTGNGRFRHVTPGTWMVLPPRAGQTGVSIHAEGLNRDGRLAISCTTDGARPRMVFDQYFGTNLHRPVDARDVSAEQVTLVIDGRSFDGVLAYDIGPRTWSGEAPWDPGFWDAFGWGNQLDLVNSAGTVVSHFRLRNSDAARGAVRQYCGL